MKLGGAEKKKRERRNYKWEGEKKSGGAENDIKVYVDSVREKRKKERKKDRQTERKKERKKENYDFVEFVF